jgi:SnoaL-like domain
MSGNRYADDLEQIRQLKYRYLRTLDTKQWEEFADCFVPDATADYAGLTFPDRDALVEFMRANLGPDMVTMHHCHHPEIEVDGDTAKGRWYLHDQVISAEHRFRLEGAAFYEDRYVRTHGGWRVSHTGYERTFEATYQLDDTPGFKLTIGSSA